MRILMVTPYAPNRDGIAAYALQAVAALRRAGHDVEVLSPGPSAAHHHLDLRTPRGALALAKRVRAYDKLVVQFHPDVFYRIPASVAQLVASHLALTAAFAAAREVEVWLHEIDYRWGQGSGPAAVAARNLWRSVDRVMVHTETERENFVRAFAVPDAKVIVGEHGAHFVPRTRHTRETARKSLGIPTEEFCFLAIGFIQPHKGFHRAVEAFSLADLGSRGCRLDVVGSVRLDAPELVAYVAELEASVERTPGVHLREGYVSDEMFDRWLVASDVVVLPYQHIWSSGVLERAGLFGRKVVATDVGGLSHQAAARSAEVTLVPNGPQVVTSLAAAMCSAAGLAARERAGGDEPWPVEEGRAGLQNAVAHRAAQRRGTPTRTRFDDRVLAPGGQPAPTAGSAVGVSGPTGSAPVRRLPPLMLPPARSTRVSADMAKRLVRRLTQWEIEPIVHQVNALREAVIASLEQRDR